MNKFSKGKIFITALTAILIFSVTALTVSAAENYKIFDVSLVQMYIGKLIKDLPQDKNYDANGDGKINIYDVSAMQVIIAKLDKETTEPSTTTPITAPTTEPTTASVTATATEEPETAPITVPAVPIEINFTYYEDYENLGIGETFSLEAEISGENANTVWQSSNEDVASVTGESDSLATITAKSTGSAVITAITQTGNTDSFTVNVKPQSSKIELNAYDIDLGVGETFDLNSYNPEPETYAYHRDYYSDDTNIADVTKAYGIVTAKAPGQTTIKCVLSNGQYASCNVNIHNAPSSISFVNLPSKIKVGETYTVSGSANPGAWSSSYKFWTSDSTILEIQPDRQDSAKIYAKKQGIVNVYMQSYNGITCKASLEVNGSIIKCLDVSVWQKDIDFNKVKSDGYDYVIIRAGYGKDSGQQDSRFEQNYNNAKAAGLKVGAYWYSYADSPQRAVEEAYNCLKSIKGKTFDLPIYYDLEESYQSSCDLMSIAKSWCSVIENNGYEAGVYTFLNWWNKYLDRYELLDEGYSVWLAQIDGDMSNINADIHQFTFAQQVDGISGNTDCSYIYNLNIVKRQ